MVAAKKSNKPAKKTRVAILGRSATSLLKWMGREGFSSEAARNVVSRLASGPIAPSTIATALSDGKNPKYQSGMAKVSRNEAREIKKASK